MGDKAERKPDPDAARLTKIAEGLEKRGVPSELLPPLTALVFDARVVRLEDAETPWPLYATTTLNARDDLQLLVDWLENKSEGARSRDTFGLSCAIEDDEGDVVQIADETVRRKRIVRALRSAVRALELIDTDYLRGRRSAWVLFGSFHWTPATKQHPVGHIVTFVAHAIASAHGFKARSPGDDPSPHEIAKATQAVFGRAKAEAKASSTYTALSDVRKTLKKARRPESPELHTRLARRYWRRADVLRGRHGDAAVRGWAPDVAGRWLRKP